MSDDGKGDSTLATKQGDPTLIAQGWERRFMTDRQRAIEAADLYRLGGFEVRVEAVRVEDLPDGCTDCRLFESLGWATIYTRKPTDAFSRGGKGSAA